MIVASDVVSDARAVTVFRDVTLEAATLGTISFKRIAAGISTSCLTAVTIREGTNSVALISIRISTNSSVTHVIIKRIGGITGTASSFEKAIKTASFFFGGITKFRESAFLGSLVDAVFSMERAASITTELQRMSLAVVSLVPAGVFKKSKSESRESRVRDIRSSQHFVSVNSSFPVGSSTTGTTFIFELTTF
jgi:hypothetical protein